MSESLAKAVTMLWQGMLGIFTVIILITLVVMIFSKLDKKKN